MASSESNSSPPSKEYRTKIITLTALATLAFFVVVDKVASTRRTSDYDARAKRSEALLTEQEQREKKYQDFDRRINEREKRMQAILDQQEQATARFQKILETWERQQKEYQAYLDSLKAGHQ